MLEQFYDLLFPVIIAAITAIFAYIGEFVKKRFSNYLDTKEKIEVAKQSVHFVEQVYKTLHGDEKLNKALDCAVNWLTEKGIKYTKGELLILIEAAVNAFNNGVKK